MGLPPGGSGLKSHLSELGGREQAEAVEPNPKPGRATRNGAAKSILHAAWEGERGRTQLCACVAPGGAEMSTCACAYVDLCECTRICKWLCAALCVHVRICTCVGGMHIYAHMKCTHIYAHVCIEHTCILCGCMDICLRTCVWMCVHECVCAACEYTSVFTDACLWKHACACVCTWLCTRMPCTIYTAVCVHVYAAYMDICWCVRGYTSVGVPTNVCV